MKKFDLTDKDLKRIYAGDSSEDSSCFLYSSKDADDFSLPEGSNLSNLSLKACQDAAIKHKAKFGSYYSLDPDITTSFEIKNGKAVETKPESFEQ